MRYKEHESEPLNDANINIPWPPELEETNTGIFYCDYMIYG